MLTVNNSSTQGTQVLIVLITPLMSNILNYCVPIIEKMLHRVLGGKGGNYFKVTRHLCCKIRPPSMFPQQ